MSEPASISTGIAARYATAIFELARETDGIDALARDVAALDEAYRESSDLRTVVASPVYSREGQKAAMIALSEKMGLSPTFRDGLALMASKRRLFVLPALLRSLEARLADERGEVTVDVTSAAPLSDDQQNRLTETLKSKVGKDIKLKTTVDESLIGGLVVKVGSRMIDTSIASKLSEMQNTMKEVR